MAELAAWLAALLAPVLLLMFVALRTRRRRSYPHELLAYSRRKSAASLLLRSFRLFYDSLIDALCALLIALALSAPRDGDAGKKAVVLDCSRSMLWGQAGDRALDEAALWLYANAGDAALFILSADRDSGIPSLKKAERLKQESSGPADFAARLERSEPFLGLDYGLLATLARRGFGAITLVTDQLGPQAVGFSAVELGWRQPRALYPASARVEPEGIYLRWLELGGASPLALVRIGADGLLTRAEASSWSLSPEPDGFTLFLREAGNYLLRWDGGELAFRAPATPGLRSEGPLSARLSPILGTTTSGGRAGALLTLRDGGGRQRAGSLSIARTDKDALVLAPWRVMGQAVASGYDKRADLALGPAAFSSDESAVALWTAWQAQTDAILDFHTPEAGVRFHEEYWEPLSGGIVDAGPRREPRLATALALALIYGLKLYLSKRLRS